MKAKYYTFFVKLLTFHVFFKDMSELVVSICSVLFNRNRELAHKYI